MHTCGAIEPLLNDFIEMGLDIVNPVQLSAAGMDAKQLKEKYGDKLVFWGGGVDTQATLPQGTPEEVAAEVTARLPILSEGGRLCVQHHPNIGRRHPSGEHLGGVQGGA